VNCKITTTPADARGWGCDLDSYEIRSIKDIFDKVPSDKVDECLDGLKVLLHQGHAFRAAHEAVGVEFFFPETTTWIDDGKGEVVTRLFNKESGEELGRMEFKRVEEPGKPDSSDKRCGACEHTREGLDSDGYVNYRCVADRASGIHLCVYLEKPGRDKWEVAR